MDRAAITMATAAIGSASAESAAPANTRARSQPSSASRAMPSTTPTSPSAADATMRDRKPTVKPRSSRLRYTIAIGLDFALGPKACQATRLYDPWHDGRKRDDQGSPPRAADRRRDPGGRRQDARRRDLRRDLSSVARLQCPRGARPGAPDRRLPHVQPPLRAREPAPVEDDAPPRLAR